MKPKFNEFSYYFDKNEEMRGNIALMNDSLTLNNS